MQAKFLLGAAAAVALAPAAHAATGPDSSDPPYVVRSQPGVTTTSILTVGDSAGGYRMAGIPDGLGAFDNGDGTFTLLMNHELRENVGAIRDHGARGAFVSKWTVESETLDVESGDDLIEQVSTYDRGAAAWTGPGSGVALSRLCSADLPEPGAFFNPASGKGYDGRLLLNGEESGNEGRVFAHALDGTSWELPHLGRASWENILAHPATGDKTVTVGTDDSTPGQLYVHVGEKQAAGSPIERAGLTGGQLYGVKVAGTDTSGPRPIEPAGGFADGSRFELVPLADATTRTGAQIDSDSDAAGVTNFRRPEDGQWDTKDPNTFYFVTTNSFSAPSRLFALRFADASNPQAGGTIDQLIDGDSDEPEHHMFDNMTVSDRGDVYIQEDPGGNNWLARVWRYHPGSDRLAEVAHFRRSLFTPGEAGFMTNDEESSGIIPAPFLGEGKFLLDAQVHKAHPDSELVEYGQLLAISVPPGRK